MTKLYLVEYSFDNGDEWRPTLSIVAAGNTEEEAKTNAKELLEGYKNDQKPFGKTRKKFESCYEISSTSAVILNTCKAVSSNVYGIKYNSIKGHDE